MTSWFEIDFVKIICEQSLIKMTIVRIFKRGCGELIREFKSISAASDYVKVFAKDKLGRDYSKSYIQGVISRTNKANVNDAHPTLMIMLGIWSERSEYCWMCGKQTFSDPCEKCGKKTYSHLKVGDPIPVGGDSDDSDSDSDGWCPSYLDYD